MEVVIYTYFSPSPVNEIVSDINTEIAAVRELHGRLDDDNDGQVDSEESEEVCPTTPTFGINYNIHF